MRYRTLCLLCTLGLFSLPGHSSSPDTASTPGTPEVQLAAPAPWVETIARQAGSSALSARTAGGELYLLYDQQINAAGPKPAYFYRYMIELHSVRSIEQNSQLSLSFSPAYQTLTLHKVQLIRDGQVLDRLRADAIGLMQREQQLERLIYDGRWTASLVIDDVRQGDVLEYSYTIEGDNPAFEGHWSANISLQWSVPLVQRSFRLLWPNNRTLKIDSPQGVTLRKQRKKQYTEYRLQQTDIAELKVDSETPDWYDPYPRIRMTTFDNWQQVAHWALPHYHIDPHPAVTALAESIRQRSDDPKQQAALALHYVQDEIRYLGIEIGAGGYIPTPAAQTLERRYGDCKDKTLLLLALLKELGIPAVAALVNTEAGQNLHQEPAQITAFNHVIAKITLANTDYWVDPTITLQKARLDKIYQPDFGYALEIRPETRQLTRQQIDYSGHRKEVHDLFDLTQGLTRPVTYTVTSHYHGHYAEAMRRWMSQQSQSTLEEGFLDYYEDFYPGIETRRAMEIQDDLDNNLLSTIEHYYFTGEWQQKNENRYALSFYTDSLRNIVDKPENRRRTAPFALAYPSQQRQEMKVLLPSEWSATRDEKTIRNNTFEYRSQLEYLEDEQAIRGVYEFRGLADHVSAADTRSYIRAMDEIWEDLDFYIYHANPHQASGPRARARRP